RRRRKAKRRPPPSFDVALAATLHDPRGALRDAIRRALPRLTLLYRGVAVATSPPTSSRIKDLLAEAGVHAGSPPANRRGPLYHRSVKAALAYRTARVHYLDLDRAVHW